MPSKFSSTHILIDGPAAGRLLDFGSRIPDSDLGEDGRETEPHVTVRYGLHTQTPDAVAKLLRRVRRPIRYRLGKVGVFAGAESGKDYDVVKVEVESPDLHRLNQLLKSLPHTDTHPDYKPHATIAYVKAGLGDRYAREFGELNADGEATTVVFSNRDRQKTEIPVSRNPPKKLEYSAARYARLSLSAARPFRGPGGEEMAEHDYSDGDRKLGVVRVHPRNDGRTLHVHWIGPATAATGEAANATGVESMRSLLPELRRQYPAAEFLTGFRAGGFRSGGSGERVMLPLKPSRYSRELPAHPAVAGFRIEHALRHLTADNAATPAARQLAASVLHDGNLEALLPLADELHSHDHLEGGVHPLADQYDWHAASWKLPLDSAVGSVVEAARRNHPDLPPLLVGHLLREAAEDYPQVRFHDDNDRMTTATSIHNGLRQLVGQGHDLHELQRSARRHFVRLADEVRSGRGDGKGVATDSLHPDTVSPAATDKRLSKADVEATRYRRGDRVPDAVHAAFDAEFAKAADRLHAKHGVADLAAVKGGGTFKRLLAASGGDPAVASDTATRLLYDGGLERGHRPGQPLLPLIAAHARFGLPQEKRLRERQLKATTFTDASSPDTAFEPTTEDDEARRGLRKESKPVTKVDPVSGDSGRGRGWNTVVAAFRSFLQRGQSAPATQLRSALRLNGKRLNRLIAEAGAEVTRVRSGGRGQPAKVVTAKYDRTGSDFLAALRRVRSRQQQVLRQLAEAIGKKLRLEPMTVVDAIADHPNAAVASVAQSIRHHDEDRVKVAAAWCALQSQMPAILHFDVDGSGSDWLHSAKAVGSGEKLRADLDRHGLHSRVLLPNSRGWKVVVFDPGGKLQQRFADFARSLGQKPQSLRGTGEILGGRGDGGAKADAKDRRSYRSVISQFERQQELKRQERAGVNQQQLGQQPLQPQLQPGAAV